MVYADFIDVDYRSDECDEQTAQDLYISAFFHDFSSSDPTADVRTVSPASVKPCPPPPLLPPPISTLPCKITKNCKVRPQDVAVNVAKRNNSPAKSSAKTEKSAASDRAQLKSTKSKAVVHPHNDDSGIVINVVGAGDCSNGTPIPVNATVESEDEGLAAKYTKKAPRKKRKTKCVERNVDGDDNDDDIECGPSRKMPGWSVLQASVEPEYRPTPKRERTPVIETITNPHSLNSNRSPLIQEAASNRNTPTTSKAKKKTWRYHETSQQELWYLSDDDRFDFGSFNRRYRFRSEQECSNCRQSGHTKWRCPFPVRNICFCCGEPHRVTRCKHLVCSTCKLAGHLSEQCPLATQLVGVRCRECNHYGHGRHATLGSVCPDLWRRYHRTTREGPPMPPSRQANSEPRRVFCTNCGLRGHSVAECSSWEHDLPRPSLREVVDYNLPPKSQHTLGVWPKGNRVAVPLFGRMGRGDYGRNSDHNSGATSNGMGRRMGQPISSKKAVKRSWDDAQFEASRKKKPRLRYSDVNEDEFERPINRRKKRRQLAKLLRKEELAASNACRDRGSRKSAKVRKWRLQ